jgi:predicted nucleic acid-binding protein
MKAFIDTSSLVKLYHSEAGSGHLHEILSTDIETIYLSEIAKIEFLSAIWKKIRQRDLTGEVGSAVICCFEADFNKFQWIKLNSDVIKRAVDLLKKKISILSFIKEIKVSSSRQQRGDGCFIFHIFPSSA